MPNNEQRPPENPRGTKVQVDGLELIIRHDADDCTALAGVLVLVVHLPEGRERRRVLLTVAAAQRAAARAEAAGHRADVVLCQLMPVGVVA